MSLPLTPPYATSICTDCYVVAAGLTLEQPAEHEPLTLLENFVDIIPEVGDGSGHFSNYPCSGCGSPLAGQRYDVFVVYAWEQ